MALGNLCCNSLTVECSGCTGGLECLIVLEKVSSIKAREELDWMLDFRCRLKRRVLSKNLGCV